MFLRPFTKIITLVFFACIILGILFVTHRHQKKQVDLNLQNTSLKVKLAPITEQSIPIQITAYGKIIDPDAVDLSAQSAGTITSINFKPGDPVKKGDILFTFISNSIDDQTQKLLAAMRLAHDNYKRLSDAYQMDSSSISQANLTQAKLLYEQALATYQAARTVEKTVAPIDGYITTTTLAVGDFVNVGTPLAHIEASGSREVEYQIPSQYQSQVTLGQTLVFQPFNSDISCNAHVVYISPNLDPNDSNLVLRAKLDNSSEFTTNLDGTVTQRLSQNNKSLAVPVSLVQTDAQGFYIYTVDHNKVEKMHFETGALTNAGLMTIKSGIPINTLMVISPPSNLFEGETVVVSS